MGIGFSILEIKLFLNLKIQFLATFEKARRIYILCGATFTMEPWNTNLIDFEVDLVALVDAIVMLLMIDLRPTSKGFLEIPHIS